MKLSPSWPSSMIIIYPFLLSCVLQLFVKEMFVTSISKLFSFMIFYLMISSQMLAASILAYLLLMLVGAVLAFSTRLPTFLTAIIAAFMASIAVCVMTYVMHCLDAISFFFSSFFLRNTYLERATTIDYWYHYLSDLSDIKVTWQRFYIPLCTRFQYDSSFVVSSHGAEPTCRLRDNAKMSNCKIN